MPDPKAWSAPHFGLPGTRSHLRKAPFEEWEGGAAKQGRIPSSALVTGIDRWIYAYHIIYCRFMYICMYTMPVLCV